MSTDTRRRLRSSSLLADAEVSGNAATRVLAYATMCLRIARLMAQIEAEGPPTRAARAHGCAVLPIDVKVRTERAEGGSYS